MRVVGDVAGAAEHLHAAVGDAAAHLGREVLAHRRLQRHVLALVALARGVQHQRPRRVDLGLAVGDHGLHQLEARERLAELLRAGCRRSTASSSMRIAGPMHSAARWMRCLFSTFIAVLKPTGLRAADERCRPARGSRRSAPRTPASRPGPSSGRPAPVLSPGVPRSTRKAVTPRAARSPASVRAITVNRPAIGALVMKHLRAVEHVVVAVAPRAWCAATSRRSRPRARSARTQPVSSPLASRGR